MTGRREVRRALDGMRTGCYTNMLANSTSMKKKRKKIHSEILKLNLQKFIYNIPLWEGPIKFLKKDFMYLFMRGIGEAET